MNCSCHTLSGYCILSLRNISSLPLIYCSVDNNSNIMLYLSIQIPSFPLPFAPILSSPNHPNKIIAPSSWVARKDSSTQVSLQSIADRHTHRSHIGTSWSGSTDQRAAFCCECPLFWADARSGGRSASILQSLVRGFIMRALGISRACVAYDLFSKIWKRKRHLLLFCEASFPSFFKLNINAVIL